MCQQRPKVEIFLECSDNVGERLREQPLNIVHLAGYSRKRQRFRRRIELCAYAGLVSSRIDSIPSYAVQKDSIESMETPCGATGIGELYSLIAERCGNAAGAKQGGQQVAFGVAQTDTMPKHVRRRARDRAPL